MDKDESTKLLQLNAQYMVSRYPDAAGGPAQSTFTRSLAEELLKDAEATLAWASSTAEVVTGSIAEPPALTTSTAFGSQAAGTALQGSDVDLISDAFHGMGRVERTVYLAGLWGVKRPGADILGLTPVEFHEAAAKPTLAREISRTACCSTAAAAPHLHAHRPRP